MCKPLTVAVCAVQVTGVALATAGFIIATRWFGVPYNIVMFSHGKMGVAILVLVYSQVCLFVHAKGSM
jgi:hypothetical protein